jgi:hypothetical protein
MTPYKYPVFSVFAFLSSSLSFYRATVFVSLVIMFPQYIKHNQQRPEANVSHSVLVPPVSLDLLAYLILEQVEEQYR